MPQVITSGAREDGEFNLLPEGEVATASVLDVKEVPSNFKDEDTGEIKNQFQWDFVITEEGPFKGRRIRSWSSTNFTAHPNCKAYVWSKAVMKREFQEGESFDTDDLIGRPCRLIIGVTSDGKWNRVDSVLPTRQSTQYATNESAQETPF